MKCCLEIFMPPDFSMNAKLKPYPSNSLSRLLNLGEYVD